MKKINDILGLDIIASVVEAMLWADDMERILCRENDFPGL